MELAAANWLYDQRHEAAPYHDGSFEDWAKERSASHPYHYRDGVRLWVSDVDYSPGDAFLG